MAFYIYENWQAGPRKAVIHVGDCFFCKDGAGRGEGYDPSHAKWHGPYGTLQIAQAKSDELPGIVKRVVHRCATGL